MTIKFVKLAVISAMCLPAYAQSWYTIVPASPVAMQSLTLSASLPAGTTYRFLSLNGKATTPVTITAAQTVSSWDDGADGRPLDPDRGAAKSMQVLQSAAFSVSLIDSSVKPAKTTPITVPALAVASPLPKPVPTPTPTPAPAPTIVGTWLCKFNQMSDGTFISIDPCTAVTK